MARPKKDDKPEEPAPAAAAAAASGTVSVEEFRKTRDSVIQGLTGLQLAVGNLLSAYMSHCNSLLGEGGTESLDGPDLNRLTGAFAAGAAVEAAVETKKEKKKRAKKERDPDMPKRPLTAAFLYGQTARPIIKKDLEEQLAPGEKLGANAVNEEVTKRWNAMSEDEKQLWRNAYQENMVKYKQEMEEYAAKKGTTITVNLDDIADLTGGLSSESPAPVMKIAPAAAAAAASKPAAKRRKTGKENGVAAVTVPTTASPVPLPSAAKATGAAAPAASTPAKADEKKKKKKEAEKEASPEDARKKRSRKSKGAEEEGEAEGEKKERKRKRKTDTA